MITPIVDFVQSIGVDVKLSGTDVGYYDFNVDCPYCGYEKHLGINRETGKINCWVCGFDGIHPRPVLIDLVMIWMDVPRPVAKAELKRAMGLFGGTNRRPAAAHADDLVWPADCMQFHEPVKSRHRQDRDIAYNYWKSRGFGASDLDRHGIRFTPRIGGDEFAGRIIMPVKLSGLPVNWVGRDYTGRQKPKYKNARTDMTMVKMSALLWGIDDYVHSGSKHMRICEGIFDALTLGPMAVSVQKSKLSASQLTLIREARPQAVSIIFDPATAVDRFVKARALAAAQDISPWVRRVKLVELTGGDAAELGQKAVFEAERKTGWLAF